MFTQRYSEQASTSSVFLYANLLIVSDQQKDFQHMLQ